MLSQNQHKIGHAVEEVLDAAGNAITSETKKTKFGPLLVRRWNFSWCAVFHKYIIMPLYFNSLPFMPWYIFLINTCYAFRAILRRGIRYNWFQRPVVDHWGLRRHALVNLWRTGGETLVNKPGMVRNISCILIYVPKVIGEVVKTSNFPDMSSFFHQEIQIWI